MKRLAGIFVALTVLFAPLAFAQVPPNSASVMVPNGAGGGSASVPGQLPGTATNDNASAGNVGEYVSYNLATGSAVPLTTAIPANVISGSFTAGDWDIGCSGYLNGAISTTFNRGEISISLTSATEDTSNGRVASFPAGGQALFNNDPISLTPMDRFSLSATTTIFCVANAGFGTSTANAYGKLWGRRRR